MTRASETQDQTEAGGPGSRGWFQPLGHAAAADADGSGEAASAPHPGADANGHGVQAASTAPRTSSRRPPCSPVPAGDVADDELPTAEQAPLIRPAVPQANDGWADDGEPPPAVLTAPGSGNTAPGDTEPGQPEAGEAEDDDAGGSEPESAGAGAAILRPNFPTRPPYSPGSRPTTRPPRPANRPLRSRPPRRRPRRSRRLPPGRHHPPAAHPRRHHGRHGRGAR